jgi:hypothetical protein
MKKETQIIIMKNDKSPSATLRRALRDHWILQKDNAERREQYLNQV